MMHNDTAPCAPRGARREVGRVLLLVQVACIALLLAAGRAGATELRRSALSCGATDAAGGSFRLRATLAETSPVSVIVSGGSFRRGEGFWPGFGVLTAVAVAPSVADVIVRANALDQNRPNPFRGPTVIAYSVAEPSPVRLFVYDVSGRRVALLTDRVHPAGQYIVDWPGLDDAGQPVADGVYFYRLEVGPWSQTKKMLKLR
jgi:hypothetical protein